MAAQQIIDIEIEALQSNPLQPRGLITPESLVDLVDSIKEHGILEPLVIAKTPAGYQIIAGERRWRAARIVGLKTVPVVVKETTPQGMLEMALVENVQREDLNPLERAQAFTRLMKEFGLTNKAIAQRIGKSASYISNSLKLLALPDALKDGLLTGLITEGHARALSAIQDSRAMVEAYKLVLREAAPVRRAEDIARRTKEKIAQKGIERENLRPPLIVSEETDRLRDEIHQALGGDEKAIVKLTRSRMETNLRIRLKGHLAQTQDRLYQIHQGIVGSAK